MIGDNEQGVKTVAGNPDAIGYVSVGTAEYDATHGCPSSCCPRRRGSAAENVADGSFPLTRPLVLVTKSQLGKPLVKAVSRLRPLGQGQRSDPGAVALSPSAK